MTISLKIKGNDKTEKWLESLKKNVFHSESLRKYGERGVQALQASTPRDTGLTASSWYYDIEETKDSITINWKNRNVNKGVLIAAIIQYGHGTATGGYVEGVDYINPAMRSVFQQIAEDAWREVVR